MYVSKRSCVNPKIMKDSDSVFQFEVDDEDGIVAIQLVLRQFKCVLRMLIAILWRIVKASMYMSVYEWSKMRFQNNRHNCLFTHHYSDFVVLDHCLWHRPQYHCVLRHHHLRLRHRRTPVSLWLDDMLGQTGATDRCDEVDVSVV